MTMAQEYVASWDIAKIIFPTMANRATSEGGGIRGGGGAGVSVGGMRASSMPANMVAEPGRLGEAPSGSSGSTGIGAGLAHAASVPVPRDDSVHPNAQGRPVSFGPEGRVRDAGEERGRSTRRRANEEGDHHAQGDTSGDRRVLGAARGNSAPVIRAVTVEPPPGIVQRVPQPQSQPQGIPEQQPRTRGCHWRNKRGDPNMIAAQFQ